MNITCFNDLAKRTEKKANIVIVEAHDAHTIESVTQAAADGLITPICIGNAAKIKDMIEEIGATGAESEIIATNTAADSLHVAIELIHAGKADALMKGNLESGEFLSAVLKKENDLLAGSRLSLAALYETPNYHKLFAVSDMVINTYPDLDCKRAIIDNAVRMLIALGIEKPKVAVLAAVEKPNPKMPETLDAAALKKLNQNGEIANCIVEGPISFDLATSAEAARIKGYDSPVAGDADLLIVPDFTAGNILVKCLTGMAGARTAAAILGAKIPIILTSRSAEASDKYYSIALCTRLITIDN